jgi:hypothetical protein
VEALDDVPVRPELRLQVGLRAARVQLLPQVAAVAAVRVGLLLGAEAAADAGRAASALGDGEAGSGHGAGELSTGEPVRTGVVLMYLQTMERVNHEKKFCCCPNSVA